jgi:hypothetical protein
VIALEEGTFALTKEMKAAGRHIAESHARREEMFE